MNTFASVRTFYEYMGVYPSQSQQKLPFNWRNLSVLLTLTTMFASMAHSFFFEANTILEYAESFYITVTVLGCLINFITSLWKTKNIYMFVEKLGKFSEAKVTDDESKAIHSELHGKIEFMSKIIYYTIPAFAMIIVFLSLFGLTLINYYINDMGDESYYMPFPIIMPFNWRTPFGYFLFAAIVSVLIFVMLSCVIPSMCLTIASSVLVQFFLTLITNKVQAMNELRRKYRAEKKKQFCETVQEFADTKEFIDAFNGIVEYSITVLFMWSVLTLSVSLLSLRFKFAEKDFNPIELSRILTPLISAIVLNAAASELGEMLIREFNQFNDAFCNCKWYSFPIELQKMLLIVVANTQQPIFVQGFGNIPCTRDTFKKTCKLGFSYFMAFHRISS